MGIESKTTKTAMRTYVSLLRGINVGGNNVLLMSDLVGYFLEAGCIDVHSYIQSGNIVFKAKPSLYEGLSNKISALIAEKHGFQIPVLCRSAEELRELSTRNSLLELTTDFSKLLVYFLEKEPSEENRLQLEAKRSSADTFVLSGRELFLYCPNGIGQSKLTNATVDSKLKTISTGRNWNTVLKLIELTKT